MQRCGSATTSARRDRTLPGFHHDAYSREGTLATGVLQLLQRAAAESIQLRIFARIALEFSIRVPRIDVERVWREDLPARMNRFFEVLTIQKGLDKLLTGTTTALLQVILGQSLLMFYHRYCTLSGIGLAVTLALILGAHRPSRAGDEPDGERVQVPHGALARGGRAIRELLMSVEILRLPPVTIPSRMKQQRPARDLVCRERHFIDHRTRRGSDSNNHAVEVRHGLQRQLRDVLAVLVPMEGLSIYVPVLASISSFPIWNGAPVSSRAESEAVTPRDTGVFRSLVVTDTPVGPVRLVGRPVRPQHQHRTRTLLRVSAIRLDGSES